jgi:RNA polymerase sigma-70 factor (ECF subfamily)|tara:strand:+ start:106 stop:708 length:603 start_codon:yes stop_codon:yes gene_type:complete
MNTHTNQRSSAPTVSDQSLITRFLTGDNPAFEILFSRHRDRIFTKIFLLVRDRDVANDLFQDVFIKVIQTLRSGKYNEEGKFLPWVLRIAHNASIDHFRRNKRMKLVRSDDNYDVFARIDNGETSVEDQMIQRQEHEGVLDLLDFLPDDQRVVVEMRLQREMSFKEIAEETGVSINTALGRMRYALINLRKVMEERGVAQ